MTSSLLSPYLRQIVSGRQVFFWEVSEGKYRIAASAGRPAYDNKHVSVDSIDARPPYIYCSKGRRRFYAPQRNNPVLHRTFCSITSDKDITAFAARYGLLGFYTERIIRKRNGRATECILAESLHRWRSELAEMQRLVHLWDLVKKRRLSRIAALTSLEKDGLYIVAGRKKEMAAGRGSALYKKWLARGEQPREAAVMYLTNCINERISGGVSPQIVPAYRKHLYLRPQNLLTSMWLMFFWELTGEVRPYQCPGCREWFDPKRSSRKTCSDRCRKRLSRRNQSNPASQCAGGAV